MNETIYFQVTNSISFIILSFIICFIFDIFRAYRRYNSISKKYIIIQDIIFSSIFFLLLTISYIIIFDVDLRIYMFVSLLFGIFVYIKLFSKKVIRLCISAFKINNNIFSFIFLPIKTNLYIFKFFYIFLNKLIKKCCKKIKYVLLYIYKFFKNIKISAFTIKYKRRYKIEKKNQEKEIKSF